MKNKEKIMASNQGGLSLGVPLIFITAVPCTATHIHMLEKGHTGDPPTSQFFQCCRCKNCLVIVNPK